MEVRHASNYIPTIICIWVYRGLCLSRIFCIIYLSPVYWLPVIEDSINFRKIEGAILRPVCCQLTIKVLLAIGDNLVQKRCPKHLTCHNAHDTNCRVCSPDSRPQQYLTYLTTYTTQTVEYVLQCWYQCRPSWCLISPSLQQGYTTPICMFYRLDDSHDLPPPPIPPLPHSCPPTEQFVFFQN